MTTLEDTFLADLDDLSDNEAELNELEGDAGKEDIDMDLETLNYDDDLDSVSKLQKTQRYVDIMQKVEEALRKDSDGDHDQYKLIVDCNHLLVDIENEIFIVHNFIRDKYRLKFQELESVVRDPIVYASVVQKIGNEIDLTLVDLTGVLDKANVMSVSVIASTTKGNPLPEDVLRMTLEACGRVLDLDFGRKKVLEFVESKMGTIAPNLTAIVGSGVAAKLMGSAGSLSALAKMPACNVQVLGYKRKNLAGFSTVTFQSSRLGYLEQTKIFQTTPSGLRMRVSRLLAAKSSLAARVDATNGDPTGTNGKALREEIQKKIDKWQEPPPARQIKPLPVPCFEAKKKRGGRRLRKMKERYQVTDMRKLANKMAFGTPEESSLGDGLGVGYGMLGQARSNRLRVSIVPSKLKLNAKLAKKLKERRYTGGDAITSGLRSCLAFTPVQGIELCNPQALASFGSGTHSIYFSESRTFNKS